MLTALDRRPPLRGWDHRPSIVFALSLLAWTVWAAVQYGSGLKLPTPSLLVLLAPVVVAAGAFGGLPGGLIAAISALVLDISLNGADAFDHPIDRIGLGVAAVVSLTSSIAARRIIRDAWAAADVNAGLRAREAYLISIAEAVPNALVVLDEDGVIQGFSPGAEAQFRTRSADAFGRSIFAFLAPNPDITQQRVELRALLQAPNSGARLVVYVPGDNGTLTPLEVTMGSSRDGDRRVISALFRDITRKLEAETRIHELQDEVIFLSRMGVAHEMVAGLSHELGQPLGAIANYARAAQMLLPQPGQTGQVEIALDGIQQAVGVSSGIIRSFRDFLIDGAAGTTAIDVERLLHDVAVLTRAWFGPGRFALSVERRGDLPPLQANFAQIELVLLNLLRNGFDAAKGDTRPRLELIVTGQIDGALFEVHDNGPGIDPAAFASIFEPWKSTKDDGLGVGLAICRRVVEHYGGRIWADPPVPGEGARFSVFIPSVLKEAA